jgi:hypothetical protein
MKTAGKVMLGVAGGAAVITAIVLAAKGASAAPGPTPAPGTGILIIKTGQISGCQISIGGAVVGTTPLQLQLDPDTYQITGSLAGYQGFSVTVTVVAGQTKTIDQTLTPSGGGATTVTLVITDNLAAAVITIEGAQTSPGTYQNIAPGTYNWSASALGYVSQSGQFRIVAGQTTTLDISLTPGGGGGGGGPIEVTAGSFNATSSTITVQNNSLALPTSQYWVASFSAIYEVYLKLLKPVALSDGTITTEAVIGITTGFTFDVVPGIGQTLSRTYQNKSAWSSVYIGTLVPGATDIYSLVALGYLPANFVANVRATIAVVINGNQTTVAPSGTYELGTIPSSQ